MLSVVATAWIAAACAGPQTTIEQQWRTSNPNVGELRNVVTMCIVDDGTMKRSCEDKLAQKLARTGVRATPMYSILSSDEMKDRAAAKLKLVAAGYDGVIAMRLVSRDQELQYVPGTFDYYWGMTYDPGYLYSETVVRIETSAYSLASNQLMWSALSKTVDPDSVREGLDQVTDLAASQLQKERVIAGTPRPAPAT
jgi:hypothetical protein